MALLQLADVRVRYGSVEVLHGVLTTTTLWARTQRLLLLP